MRFLAFEDIAYAHLDGSPASWALAIEVIPNMCYVYFDRVVCHLSRDPHDFLTTMMSGNIVVCYLLCQTIYRVHERTCKRQCMLEGESLSSKASRSIAKAMGEGLDMVCVNSEPSAGHIYTGSRP